MGPADPRALFTLRESRRGGQEPCEHGSDRRETSATRVSDDLQILIFWRRKINFEKKNSEIFFFGKNRWILEELGSFWRQNQIPGGFLLRMGGFSGPYEAWRQWWMINRQWLMISDWRLMMNGWELTINDWWLMIDDWWPMSNEWWMMIDDQWSMINKFYLIANDWWLLINDWWSMINE